MRGSWASGGDRGVKNEPMGHFLHMITLEWLYWSLSPTKLGLFGWSRLGCCHLPLKHRPTIQHTKTWPQKNHWCVPRWLIYAPITEPVPICHWSVPLRRKCWGLKVLKLKCQKSQVRHTFHPSLNGDFRKWFGGGWLYKWVRIMLE